MRRFTKTTRLQADSVPDVAGPFEEVALRLSRGITFDGGKLRPGHLLNALIHVFNGLPEQDRASIAADAVARLELLLAEEDHERATAMDKLPKTVTGQTWIPGAVRDLTTGVNPKHRRPVKSAEPPIVNHTKVITDPKGGKRKSSG